MKRILRMIIAFLFMLTIFYGISISQQKVLTDQNPVWRFAVISDTQDDNGDMPDGSCINHVILDAIAADIVLQKPEFVLVSGDLVNGWLRHNGKSYSEQYADWKEALAPVLGSGIRVFPVRGNHDSGPELYVARPLPGELDLMPSSLEQLEQAYKDEIVEEMIPLGGPIGEEGFTYSFVYRNACIIGLDQYADRQHRVNRQWFDSRLRASDRTHIFVFGHEPAFRADHKDNLSFFPKERDAFWDSMGKAGVGIYFCGHDHFYNRALVPDRNGNPVRQIICGTGGGELQDWSGSYLDYKRAECEYHNDDYFGYVLVTVDGPAVKVQWRALVDPDNNTWEVMDEFCYSVGNGE